MPVSTPFSQARICLGEDLQAGEKRRGFLHDSFR